MRILALADEPSKSLWDYYDASKLEGIDLILSCGDLPAEYLSFLVTFAHCPVLYVPGNHDRRYGKKPPEGCICIDDRIYEYEGIRILGMGGSMCYNEGPHQYTEREMYWRIRRHYIKLWIMRIFRKKTVDILLTHAPARGIGDQEDLAHRGFQTFTDFMNHWEPKYMIHGHVHMNYGHQIARIQTYKNTTIINAYEKYIFEI